jgi:uncharacterized RDD family membrane protein YckC
MPPPTAGTWPGQVPPPAGAFPYGGARPPGDGGYVPPPYGGPGYGAPAYGTSGYGAGPSGQLASYGARLGGWVIDFLILLVVASIVSIPLHAVRHDRVVLHGTTSYRYHVNGVGLLLEAVIIIVYGGLLCGSGRGQTVGMMATHTRAVSASDASAPIGYPRAFGRAAFECLLAIPLFLFIPWIVDMLFPLWDSKNQTLHDKVANTVVIKV